MVAEPQAMVVGDPQIAAAAVIGVTSADAQKKNNRIQVSNTKKPLFFYLNLAKRYIKQHNYVELSALGMAIPTAVTISEILKANGVAVERKVLTSTVGAKDENKGRLVQKAKLEIVLEKSEKSANQNTISGAEPKTKSEAKAELVQTEAKAASVTDSKAATKSVDATASKIETKPEPVAQTN